VPWQAPAKTNSQTSYTRYLFPAQAGGRTHAAVLLLVRYSPAAVLLLVRNARPAAVLLLAPGRHWWAAATGVYKYPQKKSFLEPQDFRATRTHPAGVCSLEVPCRPACGNSAVVVWRKPKDRHAHFQRKSGPAGLLVVVVVVLLLLLLDLASANRTGAEARRGAEARKCGGAEGKGSSGGERGGELVASGARAAASTCPNPQCKANGREAKECKSVITRRSVTVTICFSEGLIIGFTSTRAFCPDWESQSVWDGPSDQGRTNLYTRRD